MGEEHQPLEKEELVDAVHRDAIRTDPTNPFYANHHRPDASCISQHYHHNADDSNVQKLINIIVIYTLEHGDISYTQGMTDILSPILYVMRNEADAYICFAAMVERIKGHFTEWCTGTLLKLERFRHLCEVLDPQLYHFLTTAIEEDAFALFFGMVLIECRREFAFNDSFHLLETIWAGGTCIKNSLPSTASLSSTSEADWARYMTYESPEVLQQVFDQSGMPYSAVPLPYSTMSGSYVIGYPYTFSRNPSLLSQQTPPPPGPAYPWRPNEPEAGVIPEASNSSNSSPVSAPVGINYSASNSSPSQHHRTPMGNKNGTTGNMPRSPELARVRSHSDSNLKSFSAQSRCSSTRSPYRISSASPHIQRGAEGQLRAHKLGNCSFSHSESELYDTFGSGKVAVQARLSRNPTEMSDMSSISSGVSGIDRSRSGTRNHTPDSPSVIGTRARHHSYSRDARKSTSSERRWGTSGSGGGGGSDSSGGSDTGIPNCLTSDGTDFKMTPRSVGSKGNMSSGTPQQGIRTPDTLVPGVTPDKMAVAMAEAGLSGGGEYTDPKTGMVTRVEVHQDLGDLGGGGPTHHLPQDMSTHVEVHPQPQAQNFEGRGGRGGGGVTRVEVHPQPQDSDGGDGESLLDLDPDDNIQVIERNGMITSIGHKSPLVSSTQHSREGSVRLRSHNLTSHTESDSEASRRHRRRATTSPKRVRRTPVVGTPVGTPVDFSSSSSPYVCDREEMANHRVTPVAFFDAMEKIAASASSSRGAHFPTHFTSKSPSAKRAFLDGREGRGMGGNGGGLERSNEDIVLSYHQVNPPPAEDDPDRDLVLSLVKTDEGAPRVSKEKSLSICFSECYSLFVCLSILVQNRAAIMDRGTDFYQLSTILNAQAAEQDLDKTLRVAQQLYRIYRKYQETWFGPNGNNCWLDDPDATRSADQAV